MIEIKEQENNLPRIQTAWEIEQKQLKIAEYRYEYERDKDLW